MCLTVGNKESKTPATQPIPSGSSLKAGRFGKPKNREVKGEDPSVVFVVVEFLFSAVFVFKLSPSKISSSFRVAPISATLVLLRICSIWFPASFLFPTSAVPSLLTTTFRLSTVLLSFSPRSFSTDALLGASRGKLEQREMEIARRRLRLSRESGEEFLKKKD